MIKNIPFPNPKEKKFTFIDLFAGLGGFRLSMNSVGGHCVFSSELDINAQKTYLKNFGEVPHGDITLEETQSLIPLHFDVLCGGFPCQAFSIAGHRKGFNDTRGSLFFEIIKIAEKHKPKVIFLENVKNIENHDNGNTFNTIKKSLEELGYVVYHKVLNALEYANIPQNRERIFIVCFDPKRVPEYKSFSFPEKEELKKTINDCLKKEKQDDKYYYTEKSRYYNTLIESMLSQKTIYQWRRQYIRENKNSVCPTLTANMGTGGHNVPLILTEFGIRKLTPRECLNFQGFPEKYEFPNDIAISKKYMQAGNSVVVPLVTKVCESIYNVLCQN